MPTVKAIMIKVQAGKSVWVRINFLMGMLSHSVVFK